MSVTAPAQRYVSPDGRWGYLAIHRCASSSIGQWLKHDSGYGWVRGGSFDDCEAVFVVVRDPVDRWLSAAALQIAKRVPLDPTDEHFAPQSDFIAPYLGLPLVFVAFEALPRLAPWIPKRNPSPADARTTASGLTMSETPAWSYAQDFAYWKAALR